MRRYRYWSPGDSPTLAEWIDGELSNGDFDEAIAENIENSPRDFANVIEKLIDAGEFDDAVVKRAEDLGYEEAKTA